MATQYMGTGRRKTSVACALILGIIVNKLLSKEPENTEENQ